MQRLIQGLHAFQKDIFRAKQELFSRLVKGQQPLALFITCSDSRIDPCLLTQTEPGELFIMRNAGNIVPAFGAVRGGEAATIEYAVSVLNVRDIIVCGHSQCGAMQGLLNVGQIQHLTSVCDWLRHAEATARIIRENYKHITDPKDLLTATVEENVLIQLENLRTHPSVAAAIARHDVKLHAWVYKLETGRVFAYSAEDGQFNEVEETAGQAALEAKIPAI
ncbi:MAG TPA: carbonic anhydrase [Pirellulaceae bacterium]|nr:carbonic anhydrase [Pirellulaceae bacterium]